MKAEYALEMKNITKRFGLNTANDDITIRVHKKTLHAIAGENGAGKSVLMKSLFGLHQPDSGEIYIHGKKVRFTSALDAIRAGLGMVHQHFALVENLSALDNVILGDEPSQLGVIQRQKAKEKLEALADQNLRVNWDLEVEHLSVGEKQRLEILKLLYRNANILILDEPTAVLAPHEVETLFSLLKKLRDDGCTIIVITHHLNEILDHCDEVTVLKGGKVAGSDKTKNLDEKKLVQMMVGREVKTPILPPVVENDKKNILFLHSINTTHISGSLKQLSLKVNKGEIVGIAGVEGSGQRAILESLLGLCEREGEVFFCETKLPQNTWQIRELPIGVIPEDRLHQAVALDESVAYNSIIGIESDFAKLSVLKDKEIDSWAQKQVEDYGVKCDSIRVAIRSLSGGNQQKLVVARELEGHNPLLLVAMQPTRGVDIGAIEFLHQRLIDQAKRGTAILLISSDLEEVMKLSHRICVLFDGKIVGEFSHRNGYDKNKIGLLMTGAQ